MPVMASWSNLGPPLALPQGNSGRSARSTLVAEVKRSMTDEAGENIIDARDAAESAGLIYVDDQSLGLTRRKSGKDWSSR